MVGDSPKVCHLITRLLRGGAEAKTMATVLGIDGYDFTVGFGAKYQPEQVNRLQDNNIQTKRFRLIRHYNPVTAVAAVPQVAAFFREEDFDIVHTHSTEAGIIGRFAAAIAGVSHIVHTVHGVPFTADRTQVLNRFVLACERQAAAYTDCIITNADRITEIYLDRGIGTAHQYTTIYSGIDLSAFKNVAPAQDLPGNRPRVVMVGRLAEGKGFDVLLKAAPAICDAGCALCIVGTGPLEESLSAEIRERGLDEDVFLVGYRDDIPQVLAGSDIFVLPSYREGTPRVITEAMASGLPVVATDVAGIPEQIEHAKSGYLIPPGDPAALTERVTELLADPALRHQLGEHGKQLSKQFSLETTLENVDEVYQTLLERHGPS